MANRLSDLVLTNIRAVRSRKLLELWTSYRLRTVDLAPNVLIFEGLPILLTMFI